MGTNLLVDYYAEVACIAGLLSGDDLVVDVLSVVSSSDFKYGEHWRIVKCVETMSGDKRPITLISLREELEKNNWLEAIGGEDALSKFRLIRKDGSGRIKIASSENVEFADVRSAAIRVKNLSVLSEIGKVTEQISKDSRSGKFDVNDILSRVRDISVDIDDRKTDVAVVQSDDDAMMQDHFRNLREGVKMAEPTGFDVYDLATGGLHGGDVVLISGLQKGGKSLIGLKIIDNIVQRGIPCAIFSLEMHRKEINQRRICMRAYQNGYPLEFFKLRGGSKFKISDKDADIASDTWSVLSREPLFISDYLYTRSEIMMEAERLIRRFGIKVIMLDYLQLVGGEGSMEERISTTSRETKILANRFADRGVAVISCNQLNKVGQAEARMLDVISSDHTYGSSGPVKDATVISHVNIEDELFKCTGTCENEYTDNKVTTGGKIIPIQKRLHKYMPSDGLCKCGARVVGEDIRKGYWIIERARSAQAGVKTEFNVITKFMHVEQIVDQNRELGKLFNSYS